MDAKIIPFPLPVEHGRSCSDCNWSAFGMYGTWCTLFKEQILSEAEVGSDCSEYDDT